MARNLKKPGIFDGTQTRDGAGRRVQGLDFSAIASKFAREFRAVLGKLTHTIVEIESNGALFETFEDALTIVRDGGHICINKLSPVGGQALLVVDSPLCASLVENMLGQSKAETIANIALQGREPTVLENRLLERFSGRAIQIFQKFLNENFHCLFTTTGHETHPRFLASLDPDARCITFGFKAEGQGIKGAFRIIMPASVASEYARYRNAAKSDLSKSPLAPAIFGANVTITARLGEAIMPIDDVLNMASGDIIELDRMRNEPVEVLVQGVPKYNAEIVQRNGKLALKIIALLPGGRQKK